ncbi:MAG TPA: Gfo/Idh/MocA family oxidoreductase [Acidobacteriaceae bacterium]|nr:Gfo/Idh/MocA family oxidoreductase [Acidobacteriaceae bacterium]
MKLSRRDFSRLGAMAAFSSALPDLRAQADQNAGRRLGWCIVGLGRISMGQFMPGVALSKTGRLVALVSGHREKAERQAAMYNVPSPSIYDYENFDEIAADKDIDAVYIALPNSMHAEYTIRAAHAGKHVLCEKPMATSLGDCRKMIDVCRRKKVKLMIAYRCQYHPLHLKAIELIRSGALGQVQTIESAFGFDIQKTFVFDGVRKPSWRLEKKMAGGGPLVDVGIYCLNATRYLTGEEPAEDGSGIKAIASVVDHDGRFTEVEENDSWSMKFPSGILASCSTTYGGMGTGGYFRVQGSKGWLKMDPAFPYQGMHLTGSLAGDQTIDMPDPQHDPAQFMAEADYFADCVWNDREPKTDGEEGLRDMSYISEIYKSAGLDELQS